MTLVYMMWYIWICAKIKTSVTYNIKLLKIILIPFYHKLTLQNYNIKKKHFSAIHPCVWLLMLINAPDIQKIFAVKAVLIVSFIHIISLSCFTVLSKKFPFLFHTLRFLTFKRKCACVFDILNFKFVAQVEISFENHFKKPYFTTFLTVFDLLYFFSCRGDFYYCAPMLFLLIIMYVCLIHPLGCGRKYYS